MLRVWLPLNGDLTQQGTSSISMINSNATVNTSGKIGSCYYFNASSYLYENTYNWTNFNTSQFSLCCWYKQPSPVASGNSQIICIGTNSGWNNIRIGLLRRTSSGYPMFSVSNGSSAVYYNCTATTFSLDTWNHIACTYDNGTIKIYLNGTLDKTYTTTIVPVLNSSQHLGVGAASNGAEKLTGYLNDVRIYDHCLSAAEVREISQGLVLHYKLDQNITVGENIMPNSLDMGLGSANPSTGTWRIAGSNSMTRSRVAISDTPEGNGYGFQNSGIQTPNDGSCYGIDSFPMEANTDYIISMWARITSGTEGYAGFNVYSCTVTGGSWTQKMKNYYVTQLPANGAWTKCWMSYKTNTATTRNIYIGITTGDTDVTTQMCNIHIEKGIINNNNIIEDSSGYNHNGTITGNIQIASNSSHYNSCIYSANGGSNYIQTPTLNMPTDAVTLNIWFKSLNKTPTSDYHMIVDSVGNSSGRQHYEITVHKTGYFRGGLFVNGARKVDNCTTTTGCDGNWHMLTLSYDGTAVKRYFDGIMEKSTSVAITTGLQPSTTLRLFKDGYSSYACIEASLSDFRIYCTALDADAIRQLYEVGAKVDNKGNLHTFELSESNNGRELLAIPLTTSYGNRTNIYTNYNTNGEITLTGSSSIGSNYIKINPTGSTYYYDFEVSIDANNQIYIGFERFDVAKTSRSNSACVYAIAPKPSTALSHAHYHGTVNIGTAFDANTPVDTIAVRILNDWSSANGRSMTVHKMSLREVSTLQNTKINKQGKVITTGLIEMNDKFRVHKNGIIETNEIIEL